MTIVLLIGCSESKRREYPCRVQDKSQILVAAGEAVRRARVRAGISQEELALRSGLHRTYVGGVERGERNVSLHNLHRLAEALSLSLADLMAMAEL